VECCQGLDVAAEQSDAFLAGEQDPALICRRPDYSNSRSMKTGSVHMYDLLMSATTGTLTPEQILIMNGFDFALPEILTPGGLAIVAHSTMSKRFVAALERSERKLWYVRGYIGSEPLFPPCFTVKSTGLLSKNHGEMFVSIVGSRTSSEALSFRPISNDNDRIVAFELPVEADDPAAALEDAREPFGELLDQITAFTGAPVRYIQYSVAESKESELLAFEIHVPFQTQLRFEKGMFLPPLQRLFSIPDALVREGICSESPYYRLLCAYRVKHGIEHIRSMLGKRAAELGRQEELPKLPMISSAEIVKRGANLRRTGSEKKKAEAENLNLAQLFALWSDKRNAVAHFMQKDEGANSANVFRAIVPSIGRDYRDFASSAAILMHYVRLHLNELRAFTAAHLEQRPPFQIAAKLQFGEDLRYLGALMMKPKNLLRER
jgi:hypothetical protein